MVTLFSDRIPLPMLFQIVWKRQSEFLKSLWHSGAESAVWFSRLAHGTALADVSIPRNDARPKCADRKHDGPTLTGLRHLWYRDAVERDARYDSHYFVRSGEWVEPKCADRLCALCKDRPERHPSPRRPRAVPLSLVEASDAPVEARRTSR
jgi:hypothetical protein